MRIIDNEGEDYLYPVDYFESVLFNGDREANETATVHLNPVTKGILRAEAIAAKKSVSALLRAWIDERLTQRPQGTRQICADKIRAHPSHLCQSVSFFSR